MVKLYEAISNTEIELTGDEYLDFDNSYKFEADNGHSHFITGVISCHAGCVNVVLEKAFANVT